MREGYCLQSGRLQASFRGDPAGHRPAAIFHLTQDGTLRKVSELPRLHPGEGLLRYGGNFYVEPLEIQIEFLKAAHPQKWLEGLILRHIDRVRQIESDLWVLAEREEGNL